MNAQVLADPIATLEEVQAVVHGAALDIVRQEPEVVVFEATFTPPEPVALKGYPVETARLIVRRQGDPIAIPTGPKRRWLHHNGLLGLCLWYPQDPRGLRWEWDDGFASFVSMVHRHLVYEEYWRRTGHWPVEDAPHGFGAHPIRTLDMHWKGLLWNR